LGVRGIGAALLLSLFFAGYVQAAPPAPRSSSHLYIRGAKSLSTVLNVVGHDLGNRTRKEGPPLLIILVDPSHRPAAAFAKLAGRLEKMRDRVPGSRVLLAPVSGALPPIDGLQDLAAACKTLAASPQGGVRNLLGSARRAVKAYRAWPGPKDMLLVAEVGVSAEEEMEETLSALKRAEFRFSVVAGEAAFSKPWSWAPPVPAGFVVRLTGHPDMRRDTAYPACEGPFPDTPGTWDLGLAQTSYRLTPKHKHLPSAFNLPSGFGYFHLARLCAETGGRYFMFGFVRSRSRFKLTYDYGMMRLFAPDLRSRASIVSALARHPLASALFRIWGGLAEPRCGVIRRRSPIAPGGPEGRLRSTEETLTRPNRILKLSFTGKGDTVWVTDTLRGRMDSVMAALLELDSAERAYRRETGGRIRTGDHRWMAQVDLMRLQLLRVRFHMGEILATLEDLRDADFHNESISLLPRTIYRGTTPVTGMTLPAEPEQLRALHEVIGKLEHVEETYTGTPWGYTATLGELFTWVIVLHPKGESRPIVRARSGGKKDRTPAKKPRPTTQPGSSGGGATTGGD
jgi:hypothetical protein